MNNRQLAHAWAAQSKPGGRGSNFYFVGPTLYSYGTHFPIAEFAKPDVVLFTTAGYSMSTSRHISYARGALNGLNVRVFNVPKVTYGFGGLQHESNLRSYKNRFETAVLAASRARINAARYVQEAEDLRAEQRDYVKTFKLSKLGGLAKRLPEIDAKLIASAKERAKAAIKAEQAADRKRKEKRAAELAQDRADWRAGTRRSMTYDYPGPTMLRLSNDGSTIQTSRGAEVPADVAPRLWEIVQYARKNQQADAYLFDNPNARVGMFRLREVTKNGDLVIGCHRLEYDEISRMAKTLGLPEVTP